MATAQRHMRSRSIQAQRGWPRQPPGRQPSLCPASTLSPSAKAWIASIGAIAALNPKIVVAGHKSVGASDLPENLAASQQYLRDFTTVANRGGMLYLHGERDQPHTLWISARAEVARRA